MIGIFDGPEDGMARPCQVAECEEHAMAITIHLIGIPFVLLVGLILGGVGGFLLGLRSAAKRRNPSKEAPKNE
jgi:hypothetical protein